MGVKFWFYTDSCKLDFGNWKEWLQYVARQNIKNIEKSSIKAYISFQVEHWCIHLADIPAINSPKFYEKKHLFSILGRSKLIV